MGKNLPQRKELEGQACQYPVHGDAPSCLRLAAHIAYQLTPNILSRCLLCRCSQDLDISPYVKLLPMLAGIGSPGTLQEVGRAEHGAQFPSSCPFGPFGAKGPKSPMDAV